MVRIVGFASLMVVDACTPPGCPSNTCSYYGCTSESGTSRCTSGGAATYCDQSSLQCVGPFTLAADGNHYGYCSDKYGVSNSSLSNIAEASNTAGAENLQAPSNVEVGTSCTPPGCPSNTCSYYGCTWESGSSRCTSGGAATYCDQSSLQCVGPFTLAADGNHYGYCTDKYGASNSSLSKGVNLQATSSVEVGTSCTPPGCPSNTCSYYGCTWESGSSRCTSGGAATYCDQSSLQCVGPFTLAADGNHYGYCTDKYGASNSSLSKSAGTENLQATSSVEVGTSCTPPGCPSNTCSYYGCTSESGSSRCTSGGAATYCDQSSLQCVGPFTLGADGNHYGYCSDRYSATKNETLIGDVMV